MAMAAGPGSVQKSDEEWRAILPPEHFRVLRLKDTNRRAIDRHIPPSDAFEKGLYMFDIGQNDIAGAFYSKTFDRILASIPTILTEFKWHSGIQVPVKTISIMVKASTSVHNCAGCGTPLYKSTTKFNSGCCR